MATPKRRMKKHIC